MSGPRHARKFATHFSPTPYSGGRGSGGAGTRIAVYDAWNRLVEIKHDNNGETYTLATFEYDGLGRRIVKTVDNTDQFDATYHYYYDASGGGQRKVEVRNGSDLVLKQQVWGLRYIDELVQVAINGDPVDDPEFDPDDGDHTPSYYYTVHDTQYNVIGLVDDAGDLVERYAYDRYGNRTVYQPVDGTDAWCLAPGRYSARVQVAGQSQPYGLCEVGFQGLWHDEAIDTVDNRARVYLPPLGRFAQTDPLGYPDGLNPYAAYHVMWGGVDPTGEAMMLEWATTDRAARRAAMRMAGIPTSQQPISQGTLSNGSRWYNYRTPAPGGGTRIQSVQRLIDTKVVHPPHWEAGPVKQPLRPNSAGVPRLTSGKYKVNIKPPATAGLMLGAGLTVLSVTQPAYAAEIGYWDEQVHGSSAEICCEFTEYRTTYAVPQYHGYITAAIFDLTIGGPEPVTRKTGKVWTETLTREQCKNFDHSHYADVVEGSFHPLGYRAMTETSVTTRIVE